jgi:hypothetical protein
MGVHSRNRLEYIPDSHHPGADEMDAYERVLGDAMTGDAACSDLGLQAK